MAFYTQLSLYQIRNIARGFRELGRVRDAAPIPKGAQNSNYYIYAEGGDYILTIIDDLDILPIDFITYLLQSLNTNTSVPVPTPIPTKTGESWGAYEQKPVLITRRLPGTQPLQITVKHVAAIGRALGEIHATSPAFKHSRPNARSLTWWSEFIPNLIQRIDIPKDEKSLILSEGQWRKRFLQNSPLKQLPQGIVHGDLFKDNTLFEGYRLTGVLDFFAACTDILLYDVALCLNEWCLVTDASDTVPAFIDAYQSVRRLARLEIDLLLDLLRLTAFHTWVFRIHLDHRERQGERLTAKDPTEYKKLVSPPQDPKERYSDLHKYLKQLRK